MTQSSFQLGQAGEHLAEHFLKKNGYKILARNYRVHFGEIDIIAKDGSTICFIEVKTRRSTTQGRPAEAVSKAKQNQIAKVALSYLQSKNCVDAKVRFDVVTIIHNLDRPNQPELIPNAFDLSHIVY